MAKAAAAALAARKAAVASKLSQQCSLIADIAEPPNVKKAFENSLAVAMVQVRGGGVISGSSGGGGRWCE